MDSSLPANKDRLSSTRLSRYIRFNQYFWRGPIRGIELLLRRSATILLAPTDLRTDARYVVVSNHQERIDPFIISAELPLWAWSRLTPFRYFVYNRLFFTPILHWIFVSFGCFPTKTNTRTPHGLPFASVALSLGQTPFIFPEGKRAIQGSPARPGISSLASQPGVEIIPIHIEWTPGIAKIRRYRLTVGRPFDGSKMTPDEIMQAIYALPV